MEEKKNFIINILYCALILGLIYFACNYALGILAPFLLGFIFAFLAVKISKKIFKKERKLFNIISLIILYILIIGIVALLAVMGINELVDFIAKLPNLYKTYVEPVLENLGSSKNIHINLPIEIDINVQDIFDSLLDSIKSVISSISSYLVSFSTGLISNTTMVFVNLIEMIITSFFIVADYNRIVGFVENYQSPKIKKIYLEIKDFILNTVLLVIRSYAIIMFITFVELLIGLMIIGVNNFALVAMITALLDILPVLGVGTILLPWAIFEFIVGKVSLGIGLLVLYGVISFVRNIIEPKIVGSNLDIHPLLAFASMIIGLEVFGVIGMFGLPLYVSFLTRRQKAKTNN